MNNAKLLVEIMLDKNASVTERDDAISYLNQYKDEFIEDALIKLIGDETEEHNLRNDACETLVEYWINKDAFNKKKIQTVPRYYQEELYLYIEGLKPRWVSQFTDFEPLDRSSHPT